MAGNTFPKPKSCKTLFLTTKAFSLNIQIFIGFFLGVEDSDDDSEEMSEFKFSTAPNSFFFLPMPIGRSSGFYKRAGTALPRPNGFMFPVGRRVRSIFNQKIG